MTKLSTFMGGLSSRSNSNMVQMRRSTNKKGKQAPAPPKRTRYIILPPPPHKTYNHDLIFNKAVSSVTACYHHAVLFEILPIKNRTNKMSK